MKGDEDIPKCKIIVKAESVGDSNNEIGLKMKVCIPVHKKCCTLMKD